MGDLGALVIRARTGDADAFGALVGEFQGVAVGYAFSLLGDFGLAEDAAQEAFFQAYKDLEKLREPKAFPGWFRRMVLGHCGRQARRRQPAMALIEEGLAVPCGRKHPAEIIQEHEVREHVQQAVQSLPDHERMVVSLFYIGGRSQAEIGTFLEIPVSTVKNRLYSARKRLRERMVEMVEQMLSLNKQLATAKTDHDKTTIQRQIDTTDQQIDRLVYELYGLTEEEIKIIEQGS